MLQKLCCMQLKTAGIVIGWLGVVISSIRIVLLFYVSDLIFGSMAAANTYLWATPLVGLIIVVLDLIASGSLIAGTKQERHSMVLLWLIYAVIRTVITTILSVIGYMILFSDKANDKDVDEQIFIFWTSLLVSLALEIYVFCGIYALYKQIKLSNSQIRSTTAQQPAYPNVEYKNNFNV